MAAFGRFLVVCQNEWLFSLDLEIFKEIYFSDYQPVSVTNVWLKAGRS